MSKDLLADSWVPASCTMPTVDQPLRLAEFDQFFAHDVASVTTTPEGSVRLDLRPTAEVAERAAGLAAAETSCCSFFEFGLTLTDGAVRMTISTDPSHADVLAALRRRAENVAAT